MPDTRRTRPDTRAALREHARRLFARHGYEGVSMRDIAGALGIRQSAIYNHFPSKQHLLLDLMVSHMERLLTAMREAVPEGLPPARRLEAFTRFHVAYHIDQPEDVFLAYMELRSLEDPGRTEVIALRNQYETALRGILETGRASGVFQVAEPALATRAILAMLTGVTVWFRDGGPLNREQVIEAYLGMVLRGVGR